MGAAPVQKPLAPTSSKSPRKALPAPQKKLTKTANSGSKSSVTPLQKLVGLEGEALSTGDRLALKHFAVNKTRQLIPAGHIMWVSRRGFRTKIEAISSQADVDTTSPFIQWIRAQMDGRARTGELDTPYAFNFENRRTSDDFTYPFTHAFVAPLGKDTHNGHFLFKCLSL